MMNDPRADQEMIDADGFDPTEFQEPEPRLPRGQFTLDVYNICLEYSKGKLLLKEGRFLTPYFVSRILMDDAPGSPRTPSTGAVAAVFHRWEEWRFANFRKNPLAFLDFTDHGKEVGLKGILAERAALKKQEQARCARPKE